MSDSGFLTVQVDTGDFQKAKRAIAMINDKGTYRGMFRDEIRDNMQGLKNYAVSVTHRESSNLARSHTWIYDSHRMQGTLYVDPTKFWFKGRGRITWPHKYAVYEHARGGSHAFYERTVREAAPYVLPQGLKAAVRKLPWP